ncbi:hypothetical protein [Microbacterium sp.]|uniref:hypothetical protein n=1 Tax=Microbacterium sp. TaxID=51671 RepID=UPI003F95C513
MHPSLIFHPGVLLSQSELSSARLDGVLIEVGDGYMPPDLPESAEARAASLTLIHPPGYALCGPTAAWVHGVGYAPPSCHHLQRVSERRPRVRTMPGVVFHDRLIGRAELAFVGRAAITTRLRTLTDLVLGGGVDAEAEQWMRRFATAASDLLPRVQAIIAARERMPGKRAALARIAELQAMRM